MGMYTLGECWSTNPSYHNVDTWVQEIDRGLGGDHAWFAIIEVNGRTEKEVTIRAKEIIKHLNGKPCQFRLGLSLGNNA